MLYCLCRTRGDLSKYRKIEVQLSNQTVQSAQTLMKFQNTECLTAYAHFNRKMNGSHDPLPYIGTRAVPESAIMDLQCSTLSRINIDLVVNHSEAQTPDLWITSPVLNQIT